MSITLVILIVLVVAAAAGGGVFMVVAASNRPTLTMEDTKALANDGSGGGVDVLSAKVTDVRAGGLVSAEGFGDDYESCNLMIDGYNYIKAGNETWYEAVSEYKARKVAIEWQKRGGKNQFYVVKNHRCKTLSDIGLSEGDLESLAEGKSVSFENVEFKFKKSGDGLFHKGEGGFGKKFDYWLFEADDDQYVRVEKLPGADITVSSARPTSEDQFSVMKVRG